MRQVCGGAASPPPSCTCSYLLLPLPILHWLPLHQSKLNLISSLSPSMTNFNYAHRSTPVTLPRSCRSRPLSPRATATGAASMPHLGPQEAHHLQHGVWYLVISIIHLHRCTTLSGRGLGEQLRTCCRTCHLTRTGRKMMELAA
jgi:hypothetical protein